MLRKQFSATDPFRRLKPQIRYVIGSKGSNQPIQVLNFTVSDFNKFISRVDRISGEGSGRVKIYYSDNESLVKGLGAALIRNWFSIDKSEFSKTGGEHVSFDIHGGNLKDSGLSETRLERARDYLTSVLNGGPIIEMIKWCPDGAVVSTSKYGRQANGNTYMFGKEQTITTKEDEYKAEDTTGQDVNNDGYVGDPANGKEAKDSKDEEMSMETIILIMAAVLVVALLIKKNK